MTKKLQNFLKKNLLLAISLATIIVVILVILGLKLFYLNCSYLDKECSARYALMTPIGAILTAIIALIASALTASTMYKNNRSLIDSNESTANKNRNLETSKILNERLFSIVQQRGDSNPTIREGAIYQLAALYNDWEFFSTIGPSSSNSVKNQAKNQQKFITKMIFAKPVDNKRDDREIIAINSVINDFMRNGKKSDWDLSYLDLSDLDFSGINLSRYNLDGVIAYRTNFTNAIFDGEQ